MTNIQWTGPARGIYPNASHFIAVEKIGVGQTPPQRRVFK